MEHNIRKYYDDDTDGLYLVCVRGSIMRGGKNEAYKILCA